MPTNGPPNKKAKFGSEISVRFTFTNAHDIKQALHTTQNPNVLSKGSCVDDDHGFISQPLVQPSLHYDQSYP